MIYFYRFTNEKKSQNSLKDVLVETVQIVSLTNKQNDFHLKNNLGSTNLIVKKTSSQNHSIQSEKLINSIQSEKFANVNSENSKNCFMEIERASTKTFNDTYVYKNPLNKEELDNSSRRIFFCNSSSKYLNFNLNLDKYFKL